MRFLAASFVLVRAWRSNGTRGTERKEQAIVGKIRIKISLEDSTYNCSEERLA